MTIADVSYWLFTIFNLLRIVSYLPQIYRVARDRYGASTIAYSTWTLWAAANGSTAFYAVYNVFDLPLAAINLLNALCCLAVILLTIYKRKMFRPNQTASSDTETDGGWRHNEGYREARTIVIELPAQSHISRQELAIKKMRLRCGREGDHAWRRAGRR